MIRFYQLCFLYTSKCNYNCKHCAAIYKNPRHFKLARDAVRHYIEQSRIQGIKYIVFSGGECSLYFNEIIPLIQLAHSNGQVTAITTNGDWGKHESNAKKQLTALANAGLNFMEISFDEFHIEAGATLQQVENIYKFAIHYDIDISIKMVESYPYNNTSFRLLEKTLKQREWNVLTGKLLPYGRAEEIFRACDREKKGVSFSQIGNCRNLGSIVCAPDGRCFPCCGQGLYNAVEGRFAEYMSIGNIYRDALSDVLAGFRKNPFLVILGILGPLGFKQLSLEYQIPVMFPQRIRHICDFCIWSTRNHDFNQLLNTIGEDWPRHSDRIWKCAQLLKKWNMLPYPLEKEHVGKYHNDTVL